jgi:hypothetical protein
MRMIDERMLILMDIEKLMTSRVWNWARRPKKWRQDKTTPRSGTDGNQYADDRHAVSV